MIPTFGNLYPACGWPLMGQSACYCGPGQGMVGGHLVADEVHQLGSGNGGVLAAGGRWPPAGIIAFVKRSFPLMVLKSP